MKIRGYRIELSEIEAVLLDLPEIAQAAVTTFEPEEGVIEIVAYYAFKQGAELPRNEISQALRAKLPAYMVPAFLEQLDAIPMTLSNKADLKKLPKPQLQRFSAVATGYVPPKTEKRAHHPRGASPRCCASSACRPSITSSTSSARTRCVMARVCAAIRKNPGHGRTCRCATST